tara:strand:- start:3807 stop:4931 length:1125 start_codon:yes stop_codon:yes gene_type:complete
MANYFDFIKDLKNPFTGMGKSITDPLAKGGLSILGSEVPQEYTALRDAGLLDKGQYEKSIAGAKTRGNRNAIIQGLLSFAGQDFNKGVGSVFNPAYLSKPIMTAMDTSQKQFDKLAPNVMNLEKLKEFKRTKDKEVSRLAMIKDFQSGTYGTVEDGTFTKEQMALFPQLNIAQMYDMIKPNVYAPSNLKKLQFDLSKLTPGTKSYNETQGAITKLTKKTTTPSKYQKLLEEQSNYAEGSKEWNNYQQIINNELKGTKGEVKIKNLTSDLIKEDYKTLKSMYSKLKPGLDLTISEEDKRFISDMANNIQAENKTMPRQQALSEAIKKIKAEESTEDSWLWGTDDNLNLIVPKPYTGGTSIAPGKGEWGIKRKSQG